MGWTGTYRQRGQSDKDFFQSEFGNDCEILDTARKGMTAYLKIRSIKTNEIFAAIILTRINRGEYNFYYKDMDESMGPIECQCPLRILEGLSEPSNEYAKQWRENVRKWNAEKSPKAKIGNILKFAEPLKFQNGEKHDVFKLGKSFNRFVFLPPIDDETSYKSGYHYGQYIIRRWRDRKYTIIG